MEYRREIDGLRALAVIPVIFFHAGFPGFSGGFIGVDVFFVISGYLITSIILADMRAGSFSLVKFYERRIRRLLPILFFVLLICLPFAWILLLPSDLKNFSKSLVAVSTFTSNFLFWRLSGYFDVASEFKPLLHTWSLAIEEQFYLVFPPFLMLVFHRRRQILFTALLVSAILSFFLGQYFNVDRPFFTFFLLPTRAWELLIGSLSAWHCQLNRRHRFGKVSLEIFSFIGLFGIVASVLLFSKTTPTPSFFTLIPTLSTVLLIHSANNSNLVGRFLSSRPLVAIGLLSYSAYLWHQPLFSFLRHSVDECNAMTNLSAVFLTFLLSFLSWKYIEIPFRACSAPSRRFIFSAAIGVSIFFASVGALGVFTNGFSKRYSHLDRPLAELDVFEQGKYVDKRFLNLQDKPFVTDGKRRILLIGDSFAKDLTNVVFESGLEEHIQISTHFISAACGNIVQPFDLIKYVPPEQMSACIRNGWYEKDSIQRQLVEADEIWLASRWPQWVAEKLYESIGKLELDYKKPVLVFGVKDFGRVSPKELLAIPFGDRIRLTQKASAENESINTFMREAIPSKYLIDLMNLVCTEQYECTLFDESGKILSHDGMHLTQAGAVYLGKKLKPILNKALFLNDYSQSEANWPPEKRRIFGMD